MAERLTTRVARGAEYLDEVRPDWWRSVNLERLDLVSGDDCILGQIWDDYGYAVELLRLTERDVTDYGFGLVTAASWPRLTALWRAEVATRAGWAADVERLLERTPA